MENYSDDKSVNRGRKLNDVWNHFDRQRSISMTGKSTRFTGKCKYCHNVFPGTINTLKDHITKCSQFAALTRRASSQEELNPPDFMAQNNELLSSNLPAFSGFSLPLISPSDPLSLISTPTPAVKFNTSIPSISSLNINLDEVLSKAEIALREKRSEVITCPRQFGADLDSMFSILCVNK